jgi:hypothetical protein
MSVNYSANIRKPDPDPDPEVILSAFLMYVTLATGTGTGISVTCIGYHSIIQIMFFLLLFFVLCNVVSF